MVEVTSRKAGERDEDVVELEVTTPSSDPVPPLRSAKTAAEYRQLLADMRAAQPARTRTYTGFAEVEVVRHLDAAAGSFRVQVPPEVRPASGLDVDPFPIKPGDQVVARIRNPRLYADFGLRPSDDFDRQGIYERALEEDTLLTGHVDEVQFSYDSSGGRTVTVSGRDATADLVDSSAMNDPGEWNRILPRHLVFDLISPFGIRLNVAPDDETGRRGERQIQRFRLQSGESVFAAVDRAARQRGLLVYGDALGGVILAAPGGDRRAEIDLFEDSRGNRNKVSTRGNIIAANARISQQSRFRLITVRGQRRGTDAEFGATVSEVEARAEDAEIRRYRPLLVMAENQVTFEDARDRAQWEATVRAARAAVLEVTVQGWRQRQVEDSRISRPWRVNELVRVRMPSFQLDSEFLVRSVRHTRTAEEGSRTKLSLISPLAFTARPAVELDDNPFEQFLRGDTADE